MTDMKLEDKILYRLEINYIIQSSVHFFLKQRQNTSHNSKVSCIIGPMHMYNMLKCIKCYKIINLKLATGEQ